MYLEGGGAGLSNALFRSKIRPRSSDISDMECMISSQNGGDRAPSPVGRDSPLYYSQGQTPLRTTVGLTNPRSQNTRFDLVNQRISMSRHRKKCPGPSEYFRNYKFNENPYFQAPGEINYSR